MKTLTFPCDDCLCTPLVTISSPIYVICTLIFEIINSITPPIPLLLQDRRYNSLIFETIWIENELFYMK